MVSFARCTARVARLRRPLERIIYDLWSDALFCSGCSLFCLKTAADAAYASPPPRMLAPGSSVSGPARGLSHDYILCRVPLEKSRTAKFIINFGVQIIYAALYVVQL